MKSQNQRNQPNSGATGILEIERIYLARKEIILHRIAQKMHSLAVVKLDFNKASELNFIKSHLTSLDS